MFTIDLMHMTSQKGAPACWGSNEALSRAPSPSMKPAGQPLHAIPPGRPGPAHWLRGWERHRSSSTTRARSVTSLDPQHGVIVMETWHQCIRSIWRTPKLEECIANKNLLPVCGYCMIMWHYGCVDLYQYTNWKKHLDAHNVLAIDQEKNKFKGSMTHLQNIVGVGSWKEIWLL